MAIWQDLGSHHCNLSGRKSGEKITPKSIISLLPICEHGLLLTKYTSKPEVKGSFFWSTDQGGKEWFWRNQWKTPAYLEIGRKF